MLCYGRSSVFFFIFSYFYICSNDLLLCCKGCGDGWFHSPHLLIFVRLLDYFINKSIFFIIPSLINVFANLEPPKSENLLVFILELIEVFSFLGNR